MECRDAQLGDLPGIFVTICALGTKRRRRWSAHAWRVDDVRLEVIFEIGRAKLDWLATFGPALRRAFLRGDQQRQVAAAADQMRVILAHELGHLLDEVPDLLEFGSPGLPHGVADLRCAHLEQVCALPLGNDPDEAEELVGERPGPPSSWIGFGHGGEPRTDWMS